MSLSAELLRLLRQRTHGYITEYTVGHAWLPILGCRQNDRHFADDIECIFLTENMHISIQTSLKYTQFPRA